MTLDLTTQLIPVVWSLVALLVISAVSILGAAHHS